LIKYGLAAFTVADRAASHDLHLRRDWLEVVRPCYSTRAELIAHAGVRWRTDKLEETAQPILSLKETHHE
jgi:hypothetical protein